MLLAHRHRRALVTRIVPHLWYTDAAVEAAEFYALIFPDSSVGRVTTLPSDSPSGPVGTVEVVEFTLLGSPFMAISAGPHHEFNDAISFVVECADQAEVDMYWEALLEGGGTEVMCGWLRDRYGVSWQVVPRALGEMLAHPDREKAKRAGDAVLTMVKLDLATLEAAFHGDDG